MPASTINVSYADGSPAANVRVALSFSYGGMTGDQFTDKRGEVTIQHEGTGEATVFVKGQRKARSQAPGNTSVTV